MNLNFLRLVNRTRVFSGNQNKYIGILQPLARCSTSTTTTTSPKIKENYVYHDAAPAIVDNLMASPKISALPEVGSWIKKIIEHNLTGGKNSVSLWVVSTYEMLEKPENISEEYLKLCKVLEWCVEMSRGNFLAIDDIMDGSMTRSGRPCWFRMPNVGMGAVNDTILMSCCITEMIEMHFLKTPYYVDIMRLFHEFYLCSAMGQYLDFIMGTSVNSDYSLFTMERYNTLLHYKSAYMLRLPILLALMFVKDVDKRMYADVDDITSKFAKLYQIQDDYMDCYGDEALTGKVGSDIQEKKGNWLAINALQLCNPKQKEIFTKNYGSKKPEEVAIIKSLYNELQLPELYKQKEKEMQDDIVSRIRALPSESASKLFFKLLDELNKMNH